MDYSQLSDGELQLLLQRQMAVRNPATLATWLKPGYKMLPHTRVIGEELQRLAEPDGPKRLMILAPPQVGKSELVGEFLPLWWLTLHPASKVILSSYGSQLAVKRGRNTRKLIREHGQKLGLAMSPDARSAHDWETTSGGGMRCTGVGGSVTGHRANLAICDDPHKDRLEADSKYIRDNVDDWWSSTFLTRLAPDAPLVLILTPWHEDDLRGRLMEREGDQWRIVRIPAFADSDDDPLGREYDEPLSHPNLPEDTRTAREKFWRNRQSQTSIRDWGALYMCDPQPVEGALLRPEILDAARVKIGEELPSVMRTAVAVDPSGGGRDSAGIVAGFLGADDKCYITVDHTARLSSVQWAERAVLLAVEVHADSIYIETNFGGDMVANQLRQAFDALVEQGAIDEEELMPKIEMVRARYGKRIRAAPAAQAIVEGRVKLVGDLAEFRREWGTWQEGSKESPGRIDAGTYLIMGLLKAPKAYRGQVVSPVGFEIGQLPKGYQGVELLTEVELLELEDQVCNEVGSLLAHDEEEFAADGRQREQGMWWHRSFRCAEQFPHADRHLASHEVVVDFLVGER